jgi:aminoglycoside 6'-N-acetyltransferase
VRHEATWNTGQRSEPPAAVSFRSLTHEDLPLVSTWLARPHVHRWWQHQPSLRAVKSDFGPGIDGSDPTRNFIVFEGDRPVGLIQSYRIEDHPSWRTTLHIIGDFRQHVGIDYLIGETDATGRGLGTEMIRSFVDGIWREYPGAAGIVAAVQQGNQASWRALEKAGFTRIWSGILESDDPSDTGPSHVYRRNRP